MAQKNSFLPPRLYLARPGRWSTRRRAIPTGEAANDMKVDGPTMCLYRKGGFVTSQAIPFHVTHVMFVDVLRQRRSKSQRVYLL